MRLQKDAKTELIQSVPLFAGLSRKELAEVAGLADEIDIPEGTVITREGASGREFIVIIDGTAEVVRGGNTVATLGAGGFLGEIALVTGGPRTATVSATSPVHALVIEGHAFHQLMSDAPGFMTKVLHALRDRVDRDH